MRDWNQKKESGSGNPERNRGLELPPNVMLQLELHRYGMVFKNTEFYVRKEEYRQWYDKTLTYLGSRDLRYLNRLDCYLEIVKELKGRENND